MILWRYLDAWWTAICVHNNVKKNNYSDFTFCDYLKVKPDVRRQFHTFNFLSWPWFRFIIYHFTCYNYCSSGSNLLLSNSIFKTQYPFYFRICPQYEKLNPSWLNTKWQGTLSFLPPAKNAKLLKNLSCNLEYVELRSIVRLITVIWTLFIFKMARWRVRSLDFFNILDFLFLPLFRDFLNKSLQFLGKV